MRWAACSKGKSIRAILILKLGKIWETFKKAIKSPYLSLSTAKSGSIFLNMARAEAQWSLLNMRGKLFRACLTSFKTVLNSRSVTARETKPRWLFNSAANRANFNKVKY